MIQSSRRGAPRPQPDAHWLHACCLPSLTVDTRWEKNSDFKRVFSDVTKQKNTHIIYTYTPTFIIWFLFVDPFLRNAGQQYDQRPPLCFIFPISPVKGLSWGIPRTSTAPWTSKSLSNLNLASWETCRNMGPCNETTWVLATKIGSDGNGGLNWSLSWFCCSVTGKPLSKSREITHRLFFREEGRLLAPGLHQRGGMFCNKNKDFRKPNWAEHPCFQEVNQPQILWYFPLGQSTRPAKYLAPGGYDLYRDPSSIHQR